MCYTKIINGIKYCFIEYFPNINYRVGTLLYNWYYGIICFGLEAVKDSGMTALTKTTKGEFWNGHLYLIVDINPV